MTLFVNLNNIHNSDLEVPLSTCGEYFLCVSHFSDNDFKSHLHIHYDDSSESRISFEVDRIAIHIFQTLQHTMQLHLLMLLLRLSYIDTKPNSLSFTRAIIPMTVNETHQHFFFVPKHSLSFFDFPFRIGGFSTIYIDT